MTNERSAFELRTAAKKLAYETVEKVIMAAELTGTHTPGSWVNEGAMHHLIHAQRHTYDAGIVLAESAPYLDGQADKPDVLEDLEHNVCRSVMALWCYQNGVLDDNGREGRKLREPAAVTREPFEEAP